MAARPSPAYRTSTSASKTSGAPLQSTPTTLVSPSASLTGTHPITLGSNTIIQLRCRLSSVIGPIDIGEGCIIGERASIGLLVPRENEQEQESAGVRLQPGVLIESGAIVEAASIGSFTIIEAGARVGRGAVVGANCRICAKIEIGEGERMEDGTVVFGSGWGESRVPSRGAALDGKRESWVKEQGEVLRKVWTRK